MKGSLHIEKNKNFLLETQYFYRRKKEDERRSKTIVYPPTMITSFTDLIASNGNTRWPTSSR